LFTHTYVAGYEYPGGIQALGWIVELFPLIFTILAGAWVIFDNHKKELDISLIRLGKLILFPLVYPYYISLKIR
jgi:hypothetical protein